MLIVVIGLVGLYFLGQTAADAFIQEIGLYIKVTNEPMIHRLIMTAMAVYVLLMAMPFMPGMELGLSLILVFGSKISVLVYAGTVLALTCSYLVGRLIPVRHCATAFGFLGLTRGQELMARIEPLSADERHAFLLQNAPSRVVPFFLRHRYLTLVILLNLPGNSLIGGGGGIALLAGVTGLFSPPAFLLSIALAVAPLPLMMAFKEFGF